MVECRHHPCGAWQICRQDRSWQSLPDGNLVSTAGAYQTGQARPGLAGQVWGVAEADAAAACWGFVALLASATRFLIWRMSVSSAPTSAVVREPIPSGLAQLAFDCRFSVCESTVRENGARSPASAATSI
jgi:hypothetical protein